MIEYKSCFAQSMQEMVDYRVSLGYTAASYENRLKHLDKFIEENYPLETTLTKERFTDLIKVMEDGTLTSKNLKDILEKVLEEETSIEEIIKSSGIENITDDNAIREIIKKIIEQNPESVADYKAGKDRAIKFLMGQIMKETKGSANPKMATEILIEELQ